ncbi:MAG: histidine phosphatase family protein [Candidatus Binatia bacterium]
MSLTWPRDRSLFLYLSVVVVLIAVQPASGQSTGTLRIYLARHGETDWNAERRIQGRTEVPLNSTGRRQAAELAGRLKGVRLDMVYSSNLSRSRDTAATVRGDVPVKSLAALNERDHGKFEGKLVDGSDPATEQEFRRRRQSPEDDLDGGETLSQFYARVREAFDALRKQHSAGAILIVGHSLTNQMILRAVFDLTFQQATSIRQANDELYLIELDTAHPPRLWKLITPANLGDL